MGLAIIKNNDISYPAITCDGCGKPIKNVNQAIVVYPNFEGKPITYIAGFYHKVTCDLGHTVYPCCDELNTFLKQLVWNLPLGEKVKKGQHRQVIVTIPEEDGLSSCFESRPW